MPRFDWPGLVPFGCWMMGAMRPGAFAIEGHRSAATPLAGAPSPAAPGGQETFRVDGLGFDVPY